MNLQLRGAAAGPLVVGVSDGLTTRPISPQMSAPIELVQRLIDDVMNGRDLDLLDESCTPTTAPKLRIAFSTFRAAIPDWRQEAREFVTDGHTVVARMRCSGTHHGEWQGLAPTGRRMIIDEVYLFRITDERISGVWGLEDTSTRMQQLAGDDIRLGELGSLSDTQAET